MMAFVYTNRDIRWRWIICLTLCLGAVLWQVGCHSDAFIKGAIHNEAGFDGAVTVLSESAEGSVGVVTVSIPYLDVHGKTKMGQGRLMVRRKDLASDKPLPVFCHVHYEKDPNGAKHWCDRGWAVATAHYCKESPIDVSVGDGFNLARAVIEWVRRLPFIDRAHLHIDGGSQGGYMALAMSADFFPVCATTADCPVVNWAYNLNYFDVNRPASKWPQKDIQDSPLPILCSVTGLADMAYEVFGNDLHSDTWYYLSPLSYLDAIANPVMVLCATGDMLVPMEQMTRQHLRPYDKNRFPENYQRDFDALTLCDAARKTFEEVVPESIRSTHVIPLQENSFELTLEVFQDAKKKPRQRPADLDRPWDPDRQWSLCYLDEGGPTPYASHISYEWATSPNAFVEAHRNSTPAASGLTSIKLDRLMQRYTGQLKQVPKLKDGQPANRLNFAELEQRDVITGLLDYAALGDEHRERLKSLYAAGEIKPFGDTLDLESLRKIAQNNSQVGTESGK